VENGIVCQLTLEWTEADRRRSQTVSPVPSKLVTIGRDPSCDVVLNDPTRSVSGVHAGLYFDPKTLNFHIRNLTRDRLPPKQPNPCLGEWPKNDSGGACA
jgi:hypothetical protein